MKRWLIQKALEWAETQETEEVQEKRTYERRGVPVYVMGTLKEYVERPSI